jgi:hypothetical protein
VTIEAIAGVVRRATTWDVLVRLLVVSAPLAVLAVTAALASTGLPGLLVVAVVAGAVCCAALPGSHAPAAELVALAWLWLANVADGTSGWTLVAALGVLLFHTACVLAAAAPLGGRPDRRFLTAVGRRAGFVSAVVVIVWALAALLDGGERSASAAVYSVSLVALGVLGVGLLVATRGDGSGPDR